MIDHTKENAIEALGITSEEYDKIATVVAETGNARTALSKKIEDLSLKYTDPLTLVLVGFMLGFGAQVTRSKSGWERYLK
jgi:hypothetical protein